MRKKVRILLVFFCIACLFAPIFVGSTLAASQDTQYVASESGERYHLPDCGAVKRIKAEHRMTFSSAKDAVQAGYTPCKLCKPPEAD